MFSIETDDLYKSFDSHPVLCGLNLRVPEGCVYGLVGPAGAGKTTLLHVLLGFLRRDRGSVRMLGTADISQVRSRIGYLPQGQRYHSRFTIREYLQFLGQYGPIRGRALNQRIAEDLRTVGLADLAGQMIEALTRPQLQRLGIAQALLARPALLLLDEPIDGLEVPGEHGLLDLVAGLRERGLTSLIATQRLEEAEYLCDRVGILVGGRLAAEAETRSLRGPGRNALISVAALPPDVAAQLQALSPAVQCEGHEIALQPNSPELQAQVLGALITAGITLIALEPFGRPIEDLYMRAVHGIPQATLIENTNTSPDVELSAPVSAELPTQQLPNAAPGRPGTGDTLLRELLKSEDQHNP
ncbi:MAG: ABC transporter ATP-binding protein [Roseiflexaceae bacterium]|nr:ABC transporter ATP-binding protein [Roseiflexaceae bacterium]